jgi:hypothetical protein
MTADLLERARRRRAELLRNTTSAGASPEVDCEISEKSEETRADEGLISHISLISHSDAARSGADDALLLARQRVRELRGGVSSDDARRVDLPAGQTLSRSGIPTDCEISEKSEESRTDGGLISHNSLISQSVPTQSGTGDPLLRARRRVHELRGDARSAEPQPEDRHHRRDQPVARAVAGAETDPDCEISEKSEKRSDVRPTPGLLADPFRAWRLRNAELLAEQDGRFGSDYGGYCAQHRRVLSYPEQKRGACSWCVAVDPERR